MLQLPRHSGCVAFALLLVACGGSDDETATGAGAAAATGPGATSASSAGSSSGGASTSSGPGAGGGASTGLAAKYPGDVGIEKDPDVVWAENFEEGAVDAVVARYDDAKPGGLALDAEVPPKSSGKASMKLTAGGSGDAAADFYKNLAPGYDELWVRYYARYQGGAIEWHHTGVWFGGYNPAANYPSPQAGLKPNGDDRFSVSFEPMGAGPNPRMDFYDYWMQMHSWMDAPMGDTAYYGNTLIHQAAVHSPDDMWRCIEVHVKLNPDPASGAGAELGLFTDDAPVVEFTDAAPLGYWIKDKFCPDAADGTECTDYKPPSPTLVPLDLQYRSTSSLNLNAFWPQNYITSGPAGSVWYDDMVIAKVRVGCIQ